MKPCWWVLWLPVLFVLGVVGPRVRSQEMEGALKTYRLGGSAHDDHILVEQDLVVSVNGTIVFEDSDEKFSDLAPIEFEARKGDLVQVQATDTNGCTAWITPLYLFWENKKGKVKKKTLDGAGFPCDDYDDIERPWTFYDRTFKIKK